MLQIEIDTDAGAAPPEAFHSDRLQSSPVPPGQRAGSQQGLRQGDDVVAAAAQQAIGQQ